MQSLCGSSRFPLAKVRTKSSNARIFVFFPKQCGNTWGSYGNGKKPGWLDRGGGRAVRRIHRYFRGFVLACAFRL